MRPSKLIVAGLALLLVIATASQTYADISSAAVLYLRIAPGARAAALGESYVAIADDATATHWNPAGLGASPLAGSWRNENVPFNMAPISQAAMVKSRDGDDISAYDTWAITRSGLVRYDNRKWYTYELFETKSDQTVARIVASYLNITDETKLNELVRRVATANSPFSYDYVDSVRQRVMAAVPQDYSATASLQAGFDSLLMSYDGCLINWNRVVEIDPLLAEGLKDSVLTEKELDRINFAVEKSRSRFIPEEIKIPFSVLFEGKVTALGASGENLMVGTDNGLYGFNGRQWRTFEIEDGLPSKNILCMASGTSILIGTDQGLVRAVGSKLDPVGAPGGLPAGPVTAVGSASQNSIWAVIDNQLYHFDGQAWMQGQLYSVAIGDTPETIADKFAVFGTAVEKQKYIALLYDVNRKAAIARAAAEAAKAASDTTLMVAEPGADTTMAVAPVTEPSAPATPAEEFELKFEPGNVIIAPYLAGFKGKVTAITDDGGTIWVGTDYGVLYLTNSKWYVNGYKKQAVGEGQTLDSLLSVIPGDLPYDAETYRALIKNINDLDDTAVLTPGTELYVYRNAMAAPVNGLGVTPGHAYFATRAGLLEYNGESIDRSDVGDLGHEDVIAVNSVGEALCFVGSRNVVTKVNGRTDISMMYVKWLPELADDLYYAFISGVTNIEGLGTFGGNITFISYGTITRTTATNSDPVGTFDSFDAAMTLSYGTSLTRKLKGGMSLKLLWSKLADQGAGAEVGQGSSTGFALDFGLLYHWNPRLNIGLAVTNLGPDMAYIDAAQSDPLPRNLALGFAYKLIQKEYYHFLVTAEMNKLLVGLDDGLAEEMKQLVLNGGAELMYANILAIRAGYIYDEEGDIKTVTLGVGLVPLSSIKFDFSYIPSNTNVALANTLRISLSVLP